MKKFREIFLMLIAVMIPVTANGVALKKTDINHSVNKKCCTNKTLSKKFGEFAVLCSVLTGVGIGAGCAMSHSKKSNDTCSPSRNRNGCCTSTNDCCTPIPPTALSVTFDWALDWVYDDITLFTAALPPVLALNLQFFVVSPNGQKVILGETVVDANLNDNEYFAEGDFFANFTANYNGIYHLGVNIHSEQSLGDAQVSLNVTSPIISQNNSPILNVGLPSFCAGMSAVNVDNNVQFIFSKFDFI